MSDYSLFSQLCKDAGYTFEPFVVKTADAWNLTVFHITGYTDDVYNQQYKMERDLLDKNKLPVLII